MYHVIINPASRSGRGLKIWREQVEPALNRDGVPFRCHFSERAGDVCKIVKDILSSTTEHPVHIIVLGGDGTMNETLLGISDFSQVVIGYIPTGSSNDFARDLNIPTDPVSALDLILHTGKPTYMDLGFVTYEDGHQRPFCVSCGIGYDAAVCEEALHSKMKNVLNKIGLGKLTYLSIALKQLFAAKAAGADVFITGEMKHHLVIQAAALGLFIIEAGHYETEKVVLQPLINRLQVLSDDVQYKLTRSESACLRGI